MPKLLIIDDDAYSREVLGDALEDDDYQIVSAGDGDAGLAMIRAEMPDLVLLDIDMPRKDGIAVLRDMKADPKISEIPVIMVTAVNADSQIAMSLNMGAVDHIVKPYSNTVVRARVRAALRAATSAKAGAASFQTAGTVVSFLGCKGGVGTTSIAWNVATDMAARGESVILCELSRDGGTLSRELGFSSQETLAAMFEDLPDQVRPKDLDRFCIKQASGLRVIVSAHAPDQYCEMTEEQASEIVGGLAMLAEHTIYDLPHIVMPSTLAALRQSDMVVIVLDLDPMSVHAAEITYKRLREMQISPSCIGAIISARVITSTSMTMKDVRETLECPVMGVIPSDPDAFFFAARRGVSLLEARPDSTASGAILSLSKRIEEGKWVPLQF